MIVAGPCSGKVLKVGGVVSDGVAWLDVVGKPLMVENCVVSGHEGHGWYTIDVIFAGPCSGKVLKASGAVTVGDGPLVVEKPATVRTWVVKGQIGHG